MSLANLNSSSSSQIMSFHIAFLNQALELAQQRRGFCAPNPAVGAVLVKSNEVIATATHYAPGQPHAEQILLAQAGTKAQGAALYVTLEPCCHWGKTPPCAELIIKAGVKQVYFGMLDSNPEISGKGMKLLQQAGIHCELVPHQAIANFYESYQFWWQTKRPFVTAKIALSLDGKIAGPHGKPVAITGAALKNYTHECRRKADAILTTVKTIIQDDPQLNVRLKDTILAKPIYILDRELKLPLTAQIFQTANSITLFHQPNVEKNRLAKLQALGVRCIAVNVDTDGLILNEVLAQIGKDGRHDLWVEAGGRCFQSFVNKGFMQRGLIYVAPIWLGENAQIAFSATGNMFSKTAKIKWHVVDEDAVCELYWH